MWGRVVRQMNEADRTQTSTPKSHSMCFAKYILYHNVATIKKQMNKKPNKLKQDT